MLATRTKKGTFIQIQIERQIQKFNQIIDRSNFFRVTFALDYHHRYSINLKYCER